MSENTSLQTLIKIKMKYERELAQEFFTILSKIHFILYPLI